VALVAPANLMAPMAPVAPVVLMGLLRPVLLLPRWAAKAATLVMAMESGKAAVSLWMRPTSYAQCGRPPMVAPRTLRIEASPGPKPPRR